MIKLYSTHCPRCTVLEKKLKQKNIEFTVVDDILVMKEMGIKSAPMLQVDDEPLMEFTAANKWINSQEARN